MQPNQKDQKGCTEESQQYVYQKDRRGERGSLFRALFAFLRSRLDNSLEEEIGDSMLFDRFGKIFSSQEKSMFDNIVELHQSRVEDVMIPRSDIEAVEMKMTLAKTLQLFEKYGHSRMPVYADTLDDPRGMIHIRDVLCCIIRSAWQNSETGIPDLSLVALDRPVSELNLIRDVLFVPGSMRASQLLTRMQAARTQMALVIDEHGGTDGLISMEDIVELVVGDIEDEHDDEDIMVITESRDSWILDAGVELEDIKQKIDPDFNPGIHAEEVDTIGGLIVQTLERIPDQGEIFEIIPGYSFQILEADQRRIMRVRMRRLASFMPDMLDFEKSQAS